ncbi:hypothetical protein GCM10010347_03970 [Streptomyces cirratus]|uniref:Integral membrane protein n=1 Tax=Streptomyces cirratus TaxID=68187 RepID=A0ABQ3EG87_9ACTN|nr:hypothetical protein [Streptomyces cirratus]GHB37865.1 hypothetical protein GCM10010347_03970 [Streptomyces cirratus]
MTASPQERAFSPPPPRQHAGWRFSGVYGTVLASGLLAALERTGEHYSPFYDATWVLITAVTAGLAHGYAHHMTTHQPDFPGHRWRGLGRAMWQEWPMVAATLPSVALLLLAGLTGWPENRVTGVGLALNTALLFGWGTLSAVRVGYRRSTAPLIGLADAGIGVLVIVANALIK